MFEPIQILILIHVVFDSSYPGHFCGDFCYPVKLRVYKCGSVYYVIRLSLVILLCFYCFGCAVWSGLLDGIFSFVLFNAGFLLTLDLKNIWSLRNQMDENHPTTH